MSPHLGFGLVEGFYGPPWTARTRSEVVRQLASAGLGTYFYAPKSDPRHRDRWSAPLTEEDRLELRGLFETADAVGVRVVYGLAPERLLVSGNLRFRGPRDLGSEGMRTLVSRFEDVASLGGRDFALMFDDTIATLAPWLGGETKGRAHGLVARHVRDALVARTPEASMFVVPAVYHRRAADASGGALAYARGLASVAGDIPAAWTGPRVFSSWISAEDTVAWSRATGLSPWIWNNLIANDWLPLATGESLGARGQQRLSFGPVDNVAPGVVAASRGILLNGAREPWLSVISAMTLGDLVREGTAFRPERSFERALEQVIGPHAGALVRELQVLVWRHPLAAPHRGAALRMTDLLVDVARGRRSSARADALALLQRLSTLEQRIHAELGGHAVFEELRPTALKVELLARAIQAVLAGGVEADGLALRAARIPWQTDLDAGLTRLR